ncbi:DUF397 domain-containing protein [Streptomyces spongiicola]|uniref:DUF397 domain-containing protein n=1 Tax=Streptomyces spongiicola TaxID=1690221 RepID=A0A2S1YY14_9ACTN|nr:DUF397 domain-containing protein [Streptomyces spongiicola]AWK08999.1 DUF397 domain-containing protein [Streptomyces spongiicola]GBQ03609.1 DUF397 domain-containing protein [Streptomyces spongiicola]
MSVKPSSGVGSGVEWVKSSYSTADGPECVEVAAGAGAVQVRDSKHESGPLLGFTSAAWGDFVAYAAGS